jgi:ubiquinone/menaquinone biosynthesis C-methylase UbiE
MLLNKVCEVEDFSDAELLSLLVKWFGLRFRHFEQWPSGREDRKMWEICMTLLAAQRLVPAPSERMALGVGAGTEATNFILSNMFRLVFVTDLYGGNRWNIDAPGGMLVQPSAYAAGLPHNDRRMVVQHMNACALRFEDNLFDFIYSSSAIEHFGDLQQIQQAIKEMARVLKPGGVMSFSTELKLSGGHQWLNRETYLFRDSELFSELVEPSGCVMVGNSSFEPSAKTLESVTDIESAFRDLNKGEQRLDIAWSKYPHLVLSSNELRWTSVQLTLQKPS